MNDDDQLDLEAVKASWGAVLRDAKVLDEHGVVGLQRFMFTWAILSGLTTWGYDDRWCYASYEKAKAALDAWDGQGEPSNWHRHPRTGRRVNEDGTTEVYL